MCGFFVCKKLQYLGASPDGIVECTCCGKGVLELKCPFCLGDVSNDITCLPYLSQDSEGVLKLIEEHDYYYQVQLQMLCSETKYADFFVWSPRVANGMYIIVSEF
jgi:hypothetical protein